MKTLIVPFDRMKLVALCILYLVLFITLPFICLYISLNPLVIFFILTICWFILKGMIRTMKRLIKNTPICICNKTDVQIHSLTDTTYFISYKDIESITMKEKHHAIQFIITGKHIEHSSGVYFIHIDYPFMHKQLETIKQQLLSCFQSHNVAIKVIKYHEKEVHVNV